MINSFFVQKLVDSLEYKPTDSQEIFFSKISDFIFSRNENDLFLLHGFAGTGKTTLIAALVKTLNFFNQKTVLLAPTGRAAKVFSSYSKTKVYTIHKKIYRKKNSSVGMENFSLDRNLHKDTLFIIDEASMISDKIADENYFGSGRLLNDLISYVYDSNSNCKILFLGDVAQLPPIGSDLSPALNKNEIKSYGLNVFEHCLSDVVRQNENSGILFNATMLRIKIDTCSEKVDFPKFTVNNFNDFVKLSGEDLIDEISNSYNRHSFEETLIITRSNDRANKFNQGIRKSILWYEDEISVGDILMVVKNNYFWMKDFEDIDFIANGDSLVVNKIIRYENLYGFRFADLLVKLVDYKDIEIEVKVLLDTLNINSASLDYAKMKELYYSISEDYPELKTKKQIYEKIKTNKHFNALQVKFAYAVTCHKSQGGQWKDVFIDQGYITDEMITKEYLRWLYTAITRATEKVYLINFKKEFFGE